MKTLLTEGKKHYCGRRGKDLQNQKKHYYILPQIYFSSFLLHNLGELVFWPFIVYVIVLVVHHHVNPPCGPLGKERRGGGDWCETSSRLPAQMCYLWIWTESVCLYCECSDASYTVRTVKAPGRILWELENDLHCPRQMETRRVGGELPLITTQWSGWKASLCRLIAQRGVLLLPQGCPPLSYSPITTHHMVLYETTQLLYCVCPCAES